MTWTAPPPRASTAISSARTWCARFARQYPVPTYVCEFLLGRYCASIDEEEIQEGLGDRRAAAAGPGGPERRGRTVQGRARETGTVKLIDIISARLDAKTDSYVATLPSLQLKDVRHRGQARPGQRADADGRLLRRGRPELRRRDRPGEERQAVLGRRAAPDPAFQARRAGRALRRARQFSDRRVEELPAPERRPGADRA